MPLRDDFASVPSPLETHALDDRHGFIFMAGQANVSDYSDRDPALDIGQPTRNSFHIGSLHHHCNWKLLVENVLEGYHLSVVHAETFGRSGFTSLSRSETTDTKTGSTMTIYPHDRFRKHLETALPEAVPAYQHAYVFPNLFISITNGLIFFISNLFPIKADETLLHYRLFGTHQFEKLKPALQQHLMAEAIKFTDVTLNEDKVILESCQRGMYGAVGHYTLGAREQRIDAFHRMYMTSIHDFH